MYESEKEPRQSLDMGKKQPVVWVCVCVFWGPSMY